MTKNIANHFVSVFNPEGMPDPLCDALLLPGTHSSSHDDKQDHRPRSPSPHTAPHGTGDPRVLQQPERAGLLGPGPQGTRGMIDTACGGNAAIVMEPPQLIWTPLRYQSGHFTNGHFLLSHEQHKDMCPDFWRNKERLQ